MAQDAIEAGAGRRILERIAAFGRREGVAYAAVALCQDFSPRWRSRASRGSNRHARANPSSELWARVCAAPTAPRLKLSPEGFDIIAECKLASPSAGDLSQHTADIDRRVQAYAHGGACAVSVLTEPTRFGGSLEHLEQTARTLAPLGVPVMRKDFLVDPYQVMEARAAGAGGVLVIVRMLDRSRITALLDCRGDAEDVRAARSVRCRRPAGRAGSARGAQGARRADAGRRQLPRSRHAAGRPVAARRAGQLTCRRISPRSRRAASARSKTSRRSSTSATTSRSSARR